MQHPNVSDQDMRQAALKVCNAINGREGCSCANRKGQYCESMGSIIDRMSSQSGAGQEKIVALLLGRATVRMKPRR
jgi:hypothetical protein